MTTIKNRLFSYEDIQLTNQKDTERNVANTILSEVLRLDINSKMEEF